jgi:ATP-dependent exoDNAse (exonuclease V) alpha subunit
MFLRQSRRVGELTHLEFTEMTRSNQDTPALSAEQVCKAITYLATCCDGASGLDGQGFNKADSEFGHSLAQSIEQYGRLSSAQLEYARRLCHKYRRQLQSFWLADISSEQKEASDRAEQFRLGMSEQQREAFDLAREWFYSIPEKPFVLRGFSGTGKTWTVQRIVKSLQADRAKSDRPLQIAICAPTHKARHVLESMAHEAGLKNVTVTTLHSLLRVMPGEYDANGKQKLKFNSWSKEKHYSEFDLVVCDEASMIGNELFEFICKEKTPTLFMGDPAQLPPVEDDCEESPVFSLPTGIELTQVMRYEGAIAEYVTALRSDITAQFPPRIQTSGNITRLTPQEWERDLPEAFKSAEFAENSNAVRVLAWTNKRVNDINRQIRSSIFPDATEEFVVDERLVAKEPIMKTVLATYWEKGADGTPVQVTKESKEIVMYSCAECTVEAVSTKSIELWGKIPIFVYVLTVKTDLGAEVDLIAVHPMSFDVVRSEIFGYRKDILELDKHERGSAWKNFYETLEELNLIVKGNSLLQRLQYALRADGSSSAG